MGRKSRRKKERQLIDRNISEYSFSAKDAEGKETQVRVQEYHPMGTTHLEEEDLQELRMLTPLNTLTPHVVGALCHDFPEYRFASMVVDGTHLFMCVHPSPTLETEKAMVRVVKEFS